MHLDERLIDRITSPFVGEELLGRVDALVRVRRVIHRDPNASPEASGSDRQTSSLAGRLASLLGARIPRLEKPLGSYLEVAARVAQWADKRDAFEPGHAERVTSLCAMIGEEMGLGDTEAAALMRAAMLHDIGKVAMPVEVLHQREPLEESQLRLIRTHPRRGAALLSALDKDEDVAATILYHHERPDGKGYYGLQGKATPQTARILAVAEVYDAMTSSRVKDKIPSGKALERMESTRGESLDADCVDALVTKLKPRSGKGTIPLAIRV
jgi:HD-GYP domain-containing protein (c-di-GMP phosphodiesterase class II)